MADTPTAEQETAQVVPTVLPDTPLPAETLSTASVPTAPAPTSTVMDPTPTIPVDGPDTPPVPGRAATLFAGNVWLVEQGHVPEAITDVGDVAALFGWNWNGTKLAIGRGRQQHQWEFVSDTTDLWVFDLSTKEMHQLSTGSNVHTATWSPVEDHIAYCDQESGVKVITSDGKVLYELPKGECIRSTWSPDGKALATAVYEGIDPRPEKEIENEMLVVVYLYSDTIAVLTDEGIPYAPIWSTNGKQILFQRVFVAMAPGEIPWFVADVTSGTVTRLDNAPPLAGTDPLRSPRGDFIVVGIGEEFRVLDFAGNTLLATLGRGPVWAPDGQTIVYQTQTEQWQMVTPPVEVRADATGGGVPAPVLFDYLRWKLFFAPSDAGRGER